ncbi:hypothetical protein FBQ85_21785, partial [Cytophagia bacterium CHB2]|nr:hypothetical protein [Cytophagia bacterium CHB2]
PAKSVFLGCRYFGGDVEYVLAGSGHISGVVNHPAAKKYQFWTDGKPEGEREFLKEEYDAAEGHAVRYYKITTPAGQVYTIRNYAEKSGDYYGPITVPPGQFFMMGDNRDNSQDSR